VFDVRPEQNSFSHNADRFGQTDQFGGQNFPPESVDFATLKTVEENPASLVLNDNIIAMVFTERNEVVCVPCLLAVLTVAYEIGTASVREEIGTALQSPDPAALSSALLKVIGQDPTLNSTLTGYYAQGLFECPQSDHTVAPAEIRRRQARCESIKQFVDTKGKQVDFSDANTLPTINRNVEEATRGKIKNLFSSLRADTELVFASTMVFSDQWETRLLTLQDRNRRPIPTEFHTAEGPKNVSMMFMREYMPLLDGAQDGVIGVSLPYRGSKDHNDIKMFLFTATEGKNVRDLLNMNHFTELAERTLAITRAGDIYTRLTLPRFSIKSDKHSYIDFMQQMGIHEMFNQGLGPNDKLKVDQLVHKAVISVDEQGTEAAGAAGIALVPLSAKPIPFMATFNKPFVACVYHARLNVPLFTAYVADPTPQPPAPRTQRPFG